MTIAIVVKTLSCALRSVINRGISIIAIACILNITGGRITRLERYFAIPITVSIGIGNNWEMEDALADMGCSVHAFDPTYELHKAHLAHVHADQTIDDGGEGHPDRVVQCKEARLEVTRDKVDHAIPTADGADDATAEGGPRRLDEGDEEAAREWDAADDQQVEEGERRDKRTAHDFERALGGAIVGGAEGAESVDLARRCPRRERRRR